MLTQLRTEFAYLWRYPQPARITAGQAVSVPRIDVHNQRSGKEGLKYWLEPFPIDFFDGTVWQVCYDRRDNVVRWSRQMPVLPSKIG